MTVRATRIIGKMATLANCIKVFLNVNKIIEESDLSEIEKKIEKEKVLEARREAFGESLFRYYPPWSSR